MALHYQVNPVNSGCPLVSFDKAEKPRISQQKVAFDPNLAGQQDKILNVPREIKA